jgi:N6-adenosine-specific RNA methylase IME4
LFLVVRVCQDSIVPCVAQVDRSNTMEQKKYNVIYADPPWNFRMWSEKGNARSAASNHYETKDIQDIKSMNISSLIDNNCALFMWATFPCLKEAIEVGEHWGFTYKTVAFVWVKKNKNQDTPFVGMGYYTRANAELVLLFTKGKPLKRINGGVEQVLFSEIGKHSQKPPEIRNRIVKLFGNLPRVELFARSREGFFPDYEYEGWDVFGNEVNGSIELPSVQECDARKDDSSNNDGQQNNP